MKKIILILSVFCCWQIGWTQKKAVATEEQYRLVRTTDLDKYYDGLLVTPFLCDYEAVDGVNATPFEKSMTFDDVNIFEYALKDRQTVCALYINIVKNAIIKEKNATAIVACMHDVETLKTGGIRVTVRGIPVKYKNFRPAKEADLWILKFYKDTDVPAKAGTTKTRVIDEQTEQIKE
jgi:hypothetical protein